MFDLFDSLTDWLEAVSTSPWFYLIIFLIALGDSVIPLVPSETTVILGGIAAGNGELSIWLVILLGAFGAYLGDSLAYFLGRVIGGVVRRIFFRGDKGRRRLESASSQISRRGGLLLITARFIPGGRTALTFTCGMTRQPFLSWFTRWDLLAVFVWAGYAGGLGYFFGERFDHTTAFLLAFGTALSVTVLIEVVQRVNHRRRARTVGL